MYGIKSGAGWLVRINEKFWTHVSPDSRTLPSVFETAQEADTMLQFYAVESGDYLGMVIEFTRDQVADMTLKRLGGTHV